MSRSVEQMHHEIMVLEHQADIASEQGEAVWHDYYKRCAARLTRKMHMKEMQAGVRPKQKPINLEPLQRLNRKTYSSE